MSTAATTGGRKLTYDDLLLFPDDGLRHELIDGVHYVTASPASRHQLVMGNLHFHLQLHLRQHGGGVLFLSPLDVLFSQFDVVEPDLLFVSDARRQVVTEKNVQGAPDLVIEVTSPSTRRRDEGIKLALYDRCDVVEYWVVDPKAELMRVYRRAGGRLARALELGNTPGAALTSDVFPGLSLPMAEVFL
jgi:Uma2 family endonuclease